MLCYQFHSFAQFSNQQTSGGLGGTFPQNSFLYKTVTEANFMPPSPDDPRRCSTGIKDKNKVHTFMLFKVTFHSFFLMMLSSPSSFKNLAYSFINRFKKSKSLWSRKFYIKWSMTSEVIKGHLRSLA